MEDLADRDLFTLFEQSNYQLLVWEELARYLENHIQNCVKEAGEIPIDPHQVQFLPILRPSYTILPINLYIFFGVLFLFTSLPILLSLFTPLRTLQRTLLRPFVMITADAPMSPLLILFLNLLSWSNHFESKRKYHVIIPKRYLKDDVFDVQNHLFHGFGCFPLMGLKVFHGFGCSALMGLKIFHGFGCSALMGLKVFHGFGCSTLMGLKVFHGFGCSALMGLKEVVSIFVEEKSWTSRTEFVQFFWPGKSLLKMCQRRRSMDLRLLHGVAYGHP